MNVIGCLVVVGRVRLAATLSPTGQLWLHITHHHQCEGGESKARCPRIMLETDLCVFLPGRTLESALGCVSSLRSTSWLSTSSTRGWRWWKSLCTGEKEWSWSAQSHTLKRDHVMIPSVFFAACTARQASAPTHGCCLTWWQCVWLPFTPVMRSSSTGQFHTHTHTRPPNPFTCALCVWR